MSFNNSSTSYNRKLINHVETLREILSNIRIYGDPGGHRGDLYEVWEVYGDPRGRS